MAVTLDTEYQVKLKADSEQLKKDLKDAGVESEAFTRKLENAVEALAAMGKAGEAAAFAKHISESERAVKGLDAAIKFATATTAAFNLSSMLGSLSMHKSLEDLHTKMLWMHADLGVLDKMVTGMGKFGDEAKRAASNMLDFLPIPAPDPARDRPATSGRTPQSLDNLGVKSEDFPKVETALAGLGDKLRAVGDLISGMMTTSWKSMLGFAERAITKVTSLFGTFGATGTAGAAHVNFFQQQVLNLQWAFEVVQSKAVKFFTSIVDGVINLKRDWQSMTGIFGSALGMFNKLSSITATWGVDLKAVMSIGGMVGARLLGLGVIMEGVGNAVTGVGHKMFTAFDYAIPSAMKMQDAMLKLQRTIHDATFEDDNATASFGEWRATIEQVREITDVYTTDLTTLTGKIINLGKTYDLSGEQQRELLGVMAEMIHAGADQTQVTEAFSAALGGNNLELTKLGLTVNEEVLNHTAYAQALGKSTVQMSMREKAQAAMNALHDQSAKMLAVVTQGELTHEEVLKRISNLQKDFDAQLGASSTTISRMYSEALLSVLERLHKIPDAAINAMTNTVNYTGALLIGIGELTKYSVLLVAVVNGYKIMQGMLTTNVAVQGAVNTFFSTLNGSIGTTFVRVGKLTDVFKNLGLTFVGIYGQAGSLVVSAFKNIGSAVGSLTLTLLKNPLLIQGAVIAASILLVYNVLSPFKDDIMKIVDAMPGWLKWTLATTAAITALGVALKTSAAAQAAFIASSRIFAVAMGAQVGVVSTVSGALAVLRVGMWSMVTTAIPAIISALAAASAAMLRFTLAIMTNPLFIAAASLVAAIALVVTAIGELRNEIPFINDHITDLNLGLDGLSERLDFTDEAIKRLKDGALNGLRVLIDLTKASILGLMEAGLAAVLVFYKMKEAMTSDEEELDANRQMQVELANRIEALGNVSDASFGKANIALERMTGSLAEAATTTKELGDTSEAIGDNSAKNAQIIANVMANHQKSTAFAMMTWKAFGTEFDKARIEAQLAKAQYDKLFKDFDVDAEGAADDIKKLTDAFDTMTKAQMESQKIQRDGLQHMTDDSEKARVAELRRSGHTIEALRVESAARLEAHDKQVAQLASLGKLSPEQHGIADEERLYLKREAAAAIAEERAKQADLALKKQIDLKNKLLSMDKIVDEGKLAQLKRSGEVEQALDLENSMRLAAFDKQAEDLRTLGKLGPAEELRIANARLTIIGDSQAQMVELRRKGADEGAKLYQGVLDDEIEAIEHQLAVTTDALDKAAARDLDHFEKYQQAKVAAAHKADADIADKSSLGQKLGQAGSAVAAIKKTDFSNVASASVGVGTALAGAAEGMGEKLVGVFSGSGVKNALTSSFSGAVASLGEGLSEGGSKLRGAWEGLSRAAEPFLRAANKIFSAVSDLVTQGFAVFSQAVDVLINQLLNGAFINDLTDAFKSIGDLPTQMLRAFSELGSIITKFAQQLPAVVNQLLTQLPGIVQKIVDALPAVFKNFADMLPRIAKAFGDAMPKLISGILDQMPKLIDGIIAAMLTLMDRVPEMFSNFLKKLPEIIKHLVAGIGEIISKMIDELPALIGALADNIAPIVSSLIEGITAAIPKIVVSIVHAIPGIVAAVFKAYVNFLIGMIQGVMRGLADVMTGKGGFHMPKELGELPGKIASSAKDAVDSLRNGASELFKVENYTGAGKGTTAAEKIRDAIASGTTDAIERTKGLWQTLGGFVSRAWHAVLDFFDNLFGARIGSAWHDVLDFFQTQLGGIISSAWSGVLALFNGLGSLVSDAWKFVVREIITPLTTIGSTAFMWVKTNIVDKLTGLKLPSIDMPKFSWPAMPKFSWPSMPSFSWPSMPSFSWPSIAEPSWVSKLSNPGGGGGGGGGGGSGVIGSVLGYAKGGEIKPIYASQGTMVSFTPQGGDVVPIMAKPGEGIVTEGAVARLGGAAGLKALNDGGAPAGGGGSVSITAPITIHTSQPIDDAFIRNRLGPAVMEMLRKASLNGKFVLAAGGVRTTT